MKFSLAIVLPTALVSGIAAIALPGTDTQAIGASAEAEAAALKLSAPKVLRGVGGVLNGADSAIRVWDWMHNTFSSHGHKRDTDDKYDGNLFHPDLKAFAAQKGVSIPDVDDFKQFSADADHYTIQDGDTGLAIAAAKGATFDQLQDANPFLDLDNLQIGDVLNIPGSGDDSN